MTDPRSHGVVILDYGSQYTQLIARRVREQNVYAEVLPHDATIERIQRHSPRGVILSGGPNSIYEQGAPQLGADVIQTDFPILGICYGMQAMTHALGGRVAAGNAHEYGAAQIDRVLENPLLANLPAQLDVWMSHGDRIEQPPSGFVGLAVSDGSPFAAMGDVERKRYGV